jgi:hypothetical protein
MKELTMALTITFTSKNMTKAKYEEVLRRLEAAGAGAPPGRLFHTCFGPTDQLRVVDVWSGQAEFDAFGAVLLPILASLGVEQQHPPDIQQQLNSIVG